MTTIQLLALFGVFVIGQITGGYAMYKFFRFALHHSTVVGMGVGTCENPECHRMHLKLNTLNATASMGVTQTTIGIDPKIGDILIEAFNKAESRPAIPPPPAGSDTTGV